MEPVNSTVRIKKLPCTLITQEKFLYTKELLSGRIFLGYYQERRYVPALKDYRDVVCVSNDEVDLQSDMKKLTKKWSGAENIKWVGITGPDSFDFSQGFCFWVKLKNLAFGHYWFQIKHVKLGDHEVFLQLKCIRKHYLPIVAGTVHINEKQISDWKNEAAETSETTASIHTFEEFYLNFDPKKILLSLQAHCTKTVLIVQPYMTLKNFASFVKLIITFMVVLAFGMVALIGHLGEYILKLLREFTLLVNAFTPIIIQLIDFITKIIGGLYILIAGMLFRNPYPLHTKPFKNHTAYSIPFSEATQRAPAAYAVDWRERNRILRQELLLNSVK